MAVLAKRASKGHGSILGARSHESNAILKNPRRALSLNKHERPEATEPMKTRHNAQTALMIATVAMGGKTPSAIADTPPLHGLTEVSHAQVELSGGFWGPRLETHHKVTVPHAFNCLEADGHVTNFDKVAANDGKVALMRGPIVYCFEAADNPGIDFNKTFIPKTAEIKSEHRAELLGGVTVLKTQGLDEQNQPAELTAIPYYAWANREKGPMTVWINETPVQE
jgi:hypothetical protein